MSDFAPKANLPLDALQRVDEACGRFEAAWKKAGAAGTPPRIEACLGSAAGPERVALLHELIGLDTYYRTLRGEPVAADDYRKRFPELPSAGLTRVVPGAAAAGERLPPPRLGSYVLLERLGAGGMGEVWKARHQKLGRLVAIKLIKSDKLSDAGTVKRFRREIQAAARLSHPHIVRSFDADEVGGVHFFVMELIEGVNLDDLVEQRGPLPVAEACTYLRQAALGLQHAHEQGLIHRDVKPSNLLLTKRDHQIKVLDFGLACWQADQARQETSKLTSTGTVMGTPDFISPEQARDSHDLDIRSDMYSLGCTAYFLLTAQVPFPVGTFMAKALAHQLEEPPSIETLRPEVPSAVAAVVRKLMAKEPADRYQTPLELAVALADLGFGSPDGPPTATIPPRERSATAVVA